MTLGHRGSVLPRAATNFSQGFVRGEEASDYVPFPLPLYQLDSDDVGSKLLQRLD